MLIINTPDDLVGAEPSTERQAFLQTLLDDFTTFDDAQYPESYDRTLQEGDDGFIAPMIRKEWNAGAAAAWGFDCREQIEAALA